MMLRPLAFLFVALLTATAGAQEKPGWKSFLGQAPPELEAEDDHWMNVSSKLTLSQLKGKVVWLTFNF